MIAKATILLFLGITFATTHIKVERMSNQENTIMRDGNKAGESSPLKRRHDDDDDDEPTNAKRQYVEQQSPKLTSDEKKPEKSSPSNSEVKDQAPKSQQKKKDQVPKSQLKKKSKMYMKKLESRLDGDSSFSEFRKHLNSVLKKENNEDKCRIVDSMSKCQSGNLKKHFAKYIKCGYGEVQDRPSSPPDEQLSQYIPDLIDWFSFILPLKYSNFRDKMNEMLKDESENGRCTIAEKLSIDKKIEKECQNAKKFFGKYIEEECRQVQQRKSG